MYIKCFWKTARIDTTFKNRSPYFTKAAQKCLYYNF